VHIAGRCAHVNGQRRPLKECYAVGFATVLQENNFNVELFFLRFMNGACQVINDRFS